MNPRKTSLISDGNQRETLLSGELLIQVAPGTFDYTRSFLFSSRNEFNATRQKRDLVTAEVGYTSKSRREGKPSPLFCSGPLPSLQRSLCGEKGHSNRRTVRRSSYSLPAHPRLSPWPHAFIHSQQSAWWATHPDEPTDAHHGK